MTKLTKYNDYTDGRKKHHNDRLVLVGLFIYINILNDKTQMTAITPPSQNVA